MKAAQISEYGDVSTIRLVDIETPTPKDGQVLVKVHAASLNPFDTKLRLGYFKEMAPVAFPVTLGDDFAGEVVQVGPGVSGLNVGDKVYGHSNPVFNVGSGSFAEYAVASVSHIAKMPRETGFKEAASLVVVGVSALQAITDVIKLKAGQKLFIHGGSGGIGAVAIQLAKHIGAYVVVTATEDGITLARKLGADEVIDYKKQAYKEIVRRTDAVLDLVGNDFGDHLSLLKKGGVAVSLLAQPDAVRAQALGVSALFHIAHVDTATLDALRSLIERRTIIPHISRTFPLAQIQQAFIAAESGKTRGKFVIEIS